VYKGVGSSAHPLEAGVGVDADPSDPKRQHVMIHMEELEVSMLQRNEYGI
jgi:hypothetical protein